MTHKEKILAALEKALRQSCTDAHIFTGDETSLIAAEYLVTVNAAKEIGDVNDMGGDPYKIHLEHKTSVFSNACPPRIGRIGGKGLDRFRTFLSKAQYKKIFRSGRIDIAIYKKSNQILDVPLCAIEVKGFKPSRRNVIKDLKRNAEYFSCNDETGNSQISFTCFVALQNYGTTKTDLKAEMNLSRTRDKYEKYIADSNLPNNIDHDVYTFPIRRGETPSQGEPYNEEVGLEGNEEYQFIGVIVTFSSKNN